MLVRFKELARNTSLSDYIDSNNPQYHYADLFRYIADKANEKIEDKNKKEKLLKDSHVIFDILTDKGKDCIVLANDKLIEKNSDDQNYCLIKIKDKSSRKHLDISNIEQFFQKKDWNIFSYGGIRRIDAVRLRKITTNEAESRLAKLHLMKMVHQQV
jgi:hypothetical protein